MFELGQFYVIPHTARTDTVRPSQSWVECQLTVVVQ